MERLRLRQLRRPVVLEGGVAEQVAGALRAGGRCQERQREQSEQRGARDFADSAGEEKIGKKSGAGDRDPASPAGLVLQNGEGSPARLQQSEAVALGRLGKRAILARERKLRTRGEFEICGVVNAQAVYACEFGQLAEC